MNLLVSALEKELRYGEESGSLGSAAEVEVRQNRGEMTGPRSGRSE